MRDRLPRPKLPSEQTKIDPARAVVYFDLVFQRYQAEEDRDREAEDHEDEDWVEEQRKIAVHALEEGTGDLERQAVSWLEKELGAKIWAESGFDEDGVTCKVTSLSSWEDVKRFFVKVWSICGGEDTIYLDVPFMEATRFVFYPKGVNGPRFGANEKDGEVSDWLDTHEPTMKLSEELSLNELPIVERVGLRVASWDDGTELFRVPSDIQAAYQKVLGLRVPVSRAVSFRLLGPKGELLCELYLSDWEGNSFEAHELFIAGKRSSSSDLRLLEHCVKKLVWFLLANGPEGFFSDTYEALIQDLPFPLRLPVSFAALSDHELEIDALRNHRWFTAPEGGDMLDRPLFERVADIVEGEDGNDRDKSDEAWMVPFDLGSLQYWLCHGSIIKTRDTTRRDARWTTDEGYDPPWAVRTDWIQKNGECTWYVMDGTETVVGAGRTPQEALRDVPSFVWPGEEEAWREQRTLPGHLDVDPEVYLLLGELPPPLWEERKFEEFAKEASS